MQFRLLFLLCFFCCFTGYASSASGDSLAQLDSLLVYVIPSQQIGEVVVSHSALPQEIIPVQSLSGEQLERLNAHSVADAIRYFSGVQLKDYGGIGGLKTVNVRSMGSQHVGVFYDGVEIGAAQNGVVDLGRFSLDNMEMVSIYNGQKSAIFQPAKDYASASAIYLSSKRPRFVATRKYHIRGVLKAGSFGVINPSILWEQKISKSINSSLSAEYTHASGRYKYRYKSYDPITGVGYDTTAKRQNGDIDALRIEQAMYGESRGFNWKTRVYLYSSERGYPGAVIRQTPGKYQNKDRQRDKDLFIQGSVQKRLTNFYTSSLVAKYSYNYLNYSSDPQRDQQVVVKVDNRYRLHELYLSSANLLYILPFWSANLSVDYQFGKLNANLDDFIYPQRHNLWVAAATSISLRQFKLQASLLGAYTKQSGEEGGSVDRSWNNYTPSVIASWQPFNRHQLHLRAFYKRVFRLPTFSEIYYTVVGSGASNLKPEWATQYNLGISYSKRFDRSVLQSVDFQVDGYINRVSDKIVAHPGGQQFRWTMMNIGSVRIKGVDMALGALFVPTQDMELNLRVNYTYQRALDYSDPSEELTYKNQIGYIPEHSGSVVLNGTYRLWELNYSVICTGARYSNSANMASNRISEWYTHDLSLSRSFKWSGGYKSIKLTAEVNNLFNQRYEVVNRYPMPGTNIKFILSINL